MTYDFTTVFNRRDHASLKWSGPDTELPMWIADMDYQTAPEIVAAMQAKVATGIFGYETVSEDYYAAVMDWYESQHHVSLAREWLQFSNGVMPALTAIIRELTNAGDNVVLQAPVYNMFDETLAATGRHAVAADLAYDAATHRYHIDFDVLKAQLAQPATTAMILCNPHNPIGRIWTLDEITQIAKLCQAADVLLIADEIHGDLALGDHAYISTASLPAALRANIITLISPGKTFNLAALHAGTVIVYDAALQKRVAVALQRYHSAEPNLLAQTGTIAAYTKGTAWVAALREALTTNYRTTTAAVADIPGLALVPSDATYLAWLDVSALTHDSNALTDWLNHTVHLRLNPGAEYHGNGHDFLRLNFATPPSLLNDGLARLKQGLAMYAASQH